MRIGIVAPPWIPIPAPGYGGIEEVVAGTARELARRGHDVALVAAPGQRPGGRPHAAGAGRGPRADRARRRRVGPPGHRDALMADRDVVIDHSGPLGGVLMGAAGPPALHVVHGPLGRRRARGVPGGVPLRAASAAGGDQPPPAGVGRRAAVGGGCPQRPGPGRDTGRRRPRPLPRLPRPHEPRQGRGGGHRDRPCGRDAAADRREVQGAGGAGVLRARGRAPPGRRRRVAGRAGPGRQDRAPLGRGRAGLPDPVGRAVRHGDDRVDGRRHARAGHAMGLRAGGRPRRCHRDRAGVAGGAGAGHRPRACARPWGLPRARRAQLLADDDDRPPRATAGDGGRRGRDAAGRGSSSWNRRSADCPTSQGSR